MKKTLCLVLALLMLILTMSGCKKTTGAETTGEGNNSVSADMEGYPIDFSGKDYGGYEFTFLRYDTETARGWTGIPNDIFSESTSADVLENAVYRRNDEVENMLGVKIGMKIYGSGLSTHLQQDCLSGTPSYDAVIQLTTYLYQLFNLGLIRDMSVLELDTSYDWWDKKSIDAFTVGGKTFGMVSDLTYIDKLSTIGVFFNISLAETLHTENLFDLVDSGEWTYDTLVRYAKLATDSGEDVIGISCQNDASYFFLHSANLKTVDKVNGKIELLLDSKREIEVLQNIFTMMNDYCFFNRQKAGLDVTETVKKFAQNAENLFLIRPLQTYYNIKDYSNSYGILPMPKYDSAVDDYYSSVNPFSAGTLCIPYTVDNTQRTADVLQAMGMVSRKEVMPLFYNTVLGARFAENEQCVRMLDIIFRNRIYDMGIIWNFGDIMKIIVQSGDSLTTAANTISSTVSGSREKIRNAIDSFMTDVNNYKN